MDIMLSKIQFKTTRSTPLQCAKASFAVHLNEFLTMKFRRRPLSIDYHGDAILRLAELKSRVEVFKIFVNAYENCDDSNNCDGIRNVNSLSDPSISNGKSADVNDDERSTISPYYPMNYHLKNDDPFSTFPFIGDCDQDPVSL